MLVLIQMMWFLDFVMSGRISFFSRLPISNTISNCKEKTNYEFSFVLENDLEPPGFVRIVFPEQFPANLELSNQASPVCIPECLINQRVIDFYFSYTLKAGSIYRAQIMNVVNPSKPGGTTNFYIQTISGNRIIDENLYYGLIGVSTEIVELDDATVKFEKEGVNFAGQTSIFIFQFRTKEAVVGNSFLRLYLPKDSFGIPEFPPCRAISFNRVYLGGELLCQRNYNSTDFDLIDIHGVSGSLGQGETFAVKVTLANPGYEQITDGFGIAIVKQFTNIIYQRLMGIEGLSIAPSTMTEVALNPIDSSLRVTRNKKMWFKLHFRLTNFLRKNNVIRLVIPASVKLQANFVLDYPVSYYLVQGLNDVSKEEIIQMNHDQVTNSVLIKGFNSKMDFDAIAFYLLISTPDNIGQSSPIEISTYTSELSGNLIDQDKTFAKMLVSNVQAPPFFKVDLSTNLITIDPDVVTSVVFSVQPDITVPSKGFIRFIFPEDLQLNWISTSKCVIQTTTSSNSMVQTDCTFLGRTVIVPLIAPFYRKNTYSIDLQNVVLTPQLADSYLVDVTTILSDQVTEAESYTQELTFLAMKLLEASARFISREKAELAMIKIAFTLPFDLPAATDGILDGTLFSIKFSPDATFQMPQDLNFKTTDSGGTIPCSAVGTLKPQIGDELVCKLVQGIEPSFQVINYKSAMKGDKICILIPNFKVLDGNTKIKITVVKKIRRAFYELGTTTLAVSTSGTLSPTTLVDYTSVSSSFYDVTNHAVDGAFDLTFDMKLIMMISAEQSIIIMLPTYGEGFCTSQPIKCILQGTILPCNCVQKVSWILIELGKNDEISTADSTISISGLRWPSYVNTDMGSVKIRVSSSNDLTQQFYSYPIFDQATPYSFVSAELMSELKIDTVDSTYSFEFMLPIPILRGQKLTIDFPFVYDLTKSSPAVRVQSTDLTSRLQASSNNSSTLRLNYFLSANQMTIHDMPEFPANKTLRVEMLGVYSPNFEFKLSNFNVKLLTTNNFLIAIQNNFASFYFQKADPVAEINFSLLSAIPLNADAYATYTFEFIIPNILSKGTYILFQFPEQYIYLPAEPECQVGGTLKSFKRCFASLGSIILELDADISTGEARFIVKRIKNPDKGLTSYFSIRTEYDSKVTGVSVQTQFQRLQITKQAEKLQVISSEMNPSNEGERSILTVYLLPTLTLTTNMKVMMVFPRKVDRTVGESLICTGISGLKGLMDCYADDGILYVSPNEDYVPNPDIVLGIEISGFIVPNRNSQIFDEEDLAIAIKLNTDQSYINYSANAVMLDISRAPKWLSLTSLSFSHYNCRYTANVYLNVTFYSAMPKVSSGGALFVDLPSGFSIADKRVTATSKMQDFGTNINAYIVNNRLAITGNLQDYSGDLSLTIFRVNNPTDEVDTSAFIARSFDGNNNKIIERCYENLDPIFLSFKYPGPLIVINDDAEIIINRGAVTENVNIFVEGQAAMNFFLRVNYDGLVIYPDQIIVPLGAQNQTFNISVPQDFPEGQYQFTWIMTGEKIPKIYTPIREQRIRVVTKRPILVKIAEKFLEPIVASDQTTFDSGDNSGSTNKTAMSIVVPFGGKSLPIVIELENAPDIELIVLLNKKKDYKGISLSKSSVTFDAQKRFDEFRIIFTNETLAKEEALPMGSVDLQLKGSNDAIYKLQLASIDFKIDSIDKTPPGLNSITTGEITKNQMQLYMSVSEPCTVYYVVSLKGMAPPTFAEVQRKKLDAKGTPYFIRFGEMSIYKNQISKKELLLTDLLPQFEYLVYYFLEDTGNNISGPFSYSFKTVNRDKAADVSIKIMQSFLTYKDKQDILKHVALLLSLPLDKLQEKKYYISLADMQKTSTGRRLQSSNTIADDTGFTTETALSNSPVNKVSTIFTFNIIPTPENPVYPSPRDLGLSLSKKKNLLAARIANFDSTYTIQSSEFVSYSPRYTVEPLIIDFTHEKAIIYTELDLYGWLYGVAINKNMTTNASAVSPPNSVQISLGLSSLNVPVPSGRTEISERYSGFNMTISGLTPETNYTLYLIGANAQPGYPELMDERYLILREFKTLPAPIADYVDLSGKIQKALIFGMALLFLIIL